MAAYGDGLYGDGVYGEGIVVGPVSGSLATTLPKASTAISGAFIAPPVTGSLAATLPVPTANLAGLGQVVGDLAGTLAVPTSALVGAYSPPLTASGYGLILIGYASVNVEPPLDPDATTVPLHVVTPTVPVPTLVAGRPA